MEETRCLVCLQPSSRRPAGEKEFSANREIVDDCDTLRNQLPMIFMIRKFLEIPEFICTKLLEDYGDPNMWICCCDSCFVIVEKAKDLFNQIGVLQKQYEKLQKEFKTSMLSSINSQTISDEEALTGAKYVLRSYVEYEFTSSRENKINVSVKEEILSDVDEEDFSDSQMDNMQPSPPSPQDHSDTEDPSWDIGTENKTFANSDAEIKNTENIASYDCKIKKSSNSASIKRPVQTQKRNEFPFSCDNCGKKFSKVESLEKHEKMHSAEQSFVCTTCEDVFVSKAKLDLHRKSHSSSTETDAEKPFSCEKCPTKCSTAKKLLVHERTHLLSFTCPICAKVFSRRSQFNKHKISHSGDTPHQCKTCGSSYKRLDHLKIHERQHTGEKPFACEVCGKGFSIKEKLKLHERIHTGERPFECEICLQKFSRKDKLKIHARVHTGETPYKCDVCEKAYSRSDKLKIHKERVHHSLPIVAL